MATIIEDQKKNSLVSWESPYAMNNLLFRKLDGMDMQMKEEIQQLHKEGYMRRVNISGLAINLEHNDTRLFDDDFVGGTYYFFKHDITEVELLLSSKIKPGVLRGGKDRASMRRCLAHAGFSSDEVDEIIGLRLEMDWKDITVQFSTDIRRNNKQ